MSRLRALLLLAISLLTLAALPSWAQADPGAYGIESFAASESSDEAGAHPDLTLSFKLKTEPSGELPATTRALSFDLPPGLLGNLNAVPTCLAAQFVATDVQDPSNTSSCPIDSQLGSTEVTLFKNGLPLILSEPIYSLEAAGSGTVARMGFIAEGFPTIIDLRIRSESDYGVTAKIEGAGSLIPLLSANTTIWGVPAAESHDSLRITPYEAVNCKGSPCTAPGGLARHSGLVPTPFLTNPTTCGGPREATMRASSYASPDQTDAKVAALPPVVGCSKLDFQPSLSVVPSSKRAGAPTGLDATLVVPQDETVQGRATSQLKDAVVELPRGMSIASGAGDGLSGCDALQAGYKSTQPGHCPESSKVGSAEVDVPALERPLQGSVYQRTPEPGRLFGIWLVVDELGLHIALPGEIEVDRATGQITSRFLDTPQAPVRQFRLRFKDGARAPLANPARCGSYTTRYELTPWSGTSQVVGGTPMGVDRDCAQGAFSPRFTAGTSNPVAGAYSTLNADLVREDGEENIAALDVSLPRGLLAKLAGVSVCDGAAALAGACPSASRIGTVSVAVGPGSAPLWIPQAGKEPTAVYLGGAYEGDPYSLVVKVPAQAGPFDLGTVVTRAAIHIDPETGAAGVRSDPLPQILEGVPVSYRDLRVAIDRPGFALNPTSCAEKSIVARTVSVLGTVATGSPRFQVGGCGELPLDPKLSMRLGGATHRGGFPSLRAVLKPQKGDANLAVIQGALPHSEFLEQGHIRTICTRVQFAADSCPRGSIYGHARVMTPLLDRPLKGPVYLRSSSHELPDLVLALKGQVEIDAVGRIDSIKGGGIRATFGNVPDAPLSKVVLEMRGGSKGLLVNSRNLCTSPSRSLVKFVGQNGKRHTSRPLLHSRCAPSTPTHQPQ
jgi:hypothetical protein